MNLRLSLAGTAALVKGHPWIAAEDQLSYRQPPDAGTLVKVQDSLGNFLGWAVSEGPGRAPAFRVLSRQRGVEIDAAWWAGAVERALARRAVGGGEVRGAWRLIAGEADEIPGIVADVCGGIALVSAEGEALAGRLAEIEQALLAQARLNGVWRRFRDRHGNWEPWHRSPLTPFCAGVLEDSSPGGGPSLDLAASPDAEEPLAPPPRRAWREWAAESCRGASVLVLGPLEREARAARDGGAVRVEEAPRRLSEALTQAQSWRPARVLAEVPAEARESFGRFEASRNTPRLLKALTECAAPGAEALLTSPHPALASVGAWERCFAEAEIAAEFVRPLGPGADCPELPVFREGKHRRAFLFRLPV